MSPTKNNLPAMPFYVGDWFKCTEVRALPPDYRGLWFDMICFMWESTERGVLVNPKGKPYSDEDIIRMVGLDNQNSGNWLRRLLDDGVCARREDGAIYSKRMVKDEKIRQLRKEVGLKGGNPKLLLNQKVKQNTENENEIEDESKDVKKGIVKGKRFVPPATLEQVKERIAERGSKIDPVAFHAHYETNGWRQGEGRGRPVKNWDACITTWENRKAGPAPVQKKRPAFFIVTEHRAMKWNDQDIKDKLLELKYSEFEINEALGKRF